MVQIIPEGPLLVWNSGGWITIDGKPEFQLPFYAKSDPGKERRDRLVEVAEGKYCDKDDVQESQKKHPWELAMRPENVRITQANIAKLNATRTKDNTRLSAE